MTELLDTTVRESTLAGLIKHLAWVEDRRIAAFVTGEPIGRPRDTAASVPDDDWRSAAGDSPDGQA